MLLSLPRTEGPMNQISWCAALLQVLTLLAQPEAIMLQSGQSLQPGQALQSGLAFLRSCRHET